MPERTPQEKPNATAESAEAENVFLRELLTYENPNLPKYQELITREHADDRSYIPKAFSELWLPTYYNQYKKGEEKFFPSLKQEKVLPYLKEKLRGRMLIDVGGGFASYMAELAKKVNAKTYINIEFTLRGMPKPETSPIGPEYNPLKGTRREHEFEHLPEEERKFPLESIDVKTDMLNFVSRLPSGSCCFVVNGIDFYIAKYPEYRKALLEEIKRATENGGVVFGIGSDIWEKNDPDLKSKGEELGITKFDDTDYCSKKIFEKVS